jgi:ornithine--oxo-acid transaminase
MSVRNMNTVCGKTRSVLLKNQARSSITEITRSYGSGKRENLPDLQARELKYGAHNYRPAPIALQSGKGIYLYDNHDKEYFDFLSAYSSVNQGHCHPKIVNALKKQAETLTITSRAFTTDKLGHYMEYACNLFGYDKMLPTNTGVEAGETAIKIARLWGYFEKGVPQNQAVNLFASSNFWGRSLAACSSSDNPCVKDHFGPYSPGLEMVKYNDLTALENAFKANPNIVSYMLEPIQGEAGVIIPDPGYLQGVRKLCDKYDVLMIADEVQTGLGRCGNMLAIQNDNVKPDMVCLGKALSGGLFPISAVLANDDVMMHMGPDMHGSTFGGSPLGAAVAKASLEVLVENDLPWNSEKMGKIFRDEMKSMIKDSDLAMNVTDIRGVGLMNAIECASEKDTNLLCQNLRNNFILTKPTHETVLRMAPPLIINEIQMQAALERIDNSLKGIIMGQTSSMTG